MGWVVSIWLSHIISVYNHRMDRVQEWAATHQVSLRQLTGQNVTELDFTDDRLAICLRELHEPDQWRRIESLLGNRLLRVYDLRPANTVRLDGTTATPVYVQRDDHAQGLFHLLSLAARLLALGDYTARRALADQQSELSGIYPGNPKRATARPTKYSCNNWWVKRTSSPTAVSFTDWSLVISSTSCGNTKGEETARNGRRL
ncbi:MAG: hypothetical protein IPH82_22785 [Chloroflexi bacterium]|nr:hypothetical protein [Chloroflexota bacterium]